MKEWFALILFIIVLASIVGYYVGYMRGYLRGWNKGTKYSTLKHRNLWIELGELQGWCKVMNIINKGECKYETDIPPQVSMDKDK